ncbi:MAG: hypothetical protein K6G22_03755 [Lachnospiraceae bacterium]|nr:hypothetical protein [Lachnospiraceae bacterium]
MKSDYRIDDELLQDVSGGTNRAVGAYTKSDINDAVNNIDRNKNQNQNPIGILRSITGEKKTAQLDAQVVKVVSGDDRNIIRSV